MVQGALLLGEKWGRPLYEIIPDKLPQGRLTEIELELWGRFYEGREQMKQCQI